MTFLFLSIFSVGLNTVGLPKVNAIQEPRMLSSKQTFIVKFVTPALLVGVLIFVAVLAARAPRNAGVGLGDILFSIPGLLALFSVVVAGYIVWWSLAKVKVVRMDERNLYISDYFREIQVPLVDVSDVRETRWSKTHPVTIAFQYGSEFGSEIVFIPKVKLFLMGGSHPVVGEIEEAVRQAKRPQRPPMTEG
jgi:uncharacterized integral membrane protein